jgi:hypothetical protein
MRKLFWLVFLTLISVASTNAQQTINGNEQFVPGAYAGPQLPNAASTGTTINTIAKLTGTGTAVIGATTDVANGIFGLGIVVAGAGTTGNATIAEFGQASCVFDNATTANDYVTESTTTGGDCHDAGSTLPAGQVVGAVLSTNGSAGTYPIYIFRHIGPIVVFEGTMALGTSAISSGACASTSTITTTTAGSVSNVLTSDTIKATPTVTLTGITGYVPSSSGAILSIYPPTSTGGNVTVSVCNNTPNSITPGAVTLNIQVIR